MSLTQKHGNRTLQQHPTASLLSNRFCVKSPWCHKYFTTIHTIQAGNRGAKDVFSRNQVCASEEVLETTALIPVHLRFTESLKTHCREAELAVSVQVTHKDAFHKNWDFEPKFISKATKQTGGDLVRAEKGNSRIALDMH